MASVSVALLVVILYHYHCHIRFISFICFWVIKSLTTLHIYLNIFTYLNVNRWLTDRWLTDRRQTGDWQTGDWQTGDWQTGGSDHKLWLCKTSCTLSLACTHFNGAQKKSVSSFPVDWLKLLTTNLLLFLQFIDLLIYLISAFQQSCGLIKFKVMMVWSNCTVF